MNELIKAIEDAGYGLGFSKRLDNDKYFAQIFTGNLFMVSEVYADAPEQALREAARKAGIEVE